jgi:hypothetical protein
MYSALASSSLIPPSTTSGNQFQALSTGTSPIPATNSPTPSTTVSTQQVPSTAISI